MRLTRILFIPDTHRPYHDPKAWKLALKVGARLKPDMVIVLGDFADFYAVSDHVKDPRRRQSIGWEIADVNKGLDELEGLGANRYHFVAGNHEFRLQRYLHTRAPALADLPSLQVSELFRLKSRGWGFTEYRDWLQIGKLSVTHDDDNAGPYAHAKARATYEGNVVIGHTHRMGTHYLGNAKGESKVGAMFGWLGDVGAVDYLKAVKARQWQHGVGVGFMQPNGNVHLQAIPFIGGKAVLSGVVVE